MDRDLEERMKGLSDSEKEELLNAVGVIENNSDKVRAYEIAKAKLDRYQFDAESQFDREYIKERVKPPKSKRLPVSVSLTIGVLWCFISVGAALGIHKCNKPAEQPVEKTCITYQVQDARIGVQYQTDCVTAERLMELQKDKYVTILR